MIENELQLFKDKYELISFTNKQKIEVENTWIIIRF